MHSESGKPSSVKKAIIPAAGLGTRFLPATKTIPKEMLPIAARPTLLYVVEEAVAAGIEEIIIVAGRGKTAIEDFFDTSFELESKLKAAGQQAMLDEIHRIKSLANIISIRQKEALGLGHAVLAGWPAVGDHNFAVLLGDEIATPIAADQPNATEQLVAAFDKHNHVSCVAVREVPAHEVSKYGIVAGSHQQHGEIQITHVVEKPSTENAPSRWALPGRYVFTPAIFNILKHTPPGRNGEIQLTDAMTTLASRQGMWGIAVQANRYDAGDRLGYLIANLEFSLSDPQIQPGLVDYLKELVCRL